MVASIAAAWRVASKQAGRRNSGFRVFVFCNALWIA
jgi:hypothetical protein